MPAHPLIPTYVRPPLQPQQRKQKHSRTSLCSSAPRSTSPSPPSAPSVDSSCVRRCIGSGDRVRGLNQASKQARIGGAGPSRARWIERPQQPPAHSCPLRPTSKNRTPPPYKCVYTHSPVPGARLVRLNDLPAGAAFFARRRRMAAWTRRPRCPPPPPAAGSFASVPCVFRGWWCVMMYTSVDPFGIDCGGPNRPMGRIDRSVGRRCQAGSAQGIIIWIGLSRASAKNEKPLGSNGSSNDS